MVHIDWPTPLDWPWRNPSGHTFHLHSFIWGDVRLQFPFSFRFVFCFVLGVWTQWQVSLTSQITAVDLSLGSYFDNFWRHQCTWNGRCNVIKLNTITRSFSFEMHFDRYNAGMDRQTTYHQLASILDSEVHWREMFKLYVSSSSLVVMVMVVPSQREFEIVFNFNSTLCFHHSECYFKLTTSTLCCYFLFGFVFFFISHPSLALLLTSWQIY